MKKVVVCLVICFYVTPIFSQKNDSLKYKSLLFGFNIGLNYSSLVSKQISDANTKVSTGTGFRLGFIMDYSFNKKMSVSPKMELSFNDCSVAYAANAGVVGAYEVFPINIDLMCHFLFKSDKKLKSYFLVGPNFKLPISNDQHFRIDYGNYSDLAIDIGYGIEKILPYFKIAPELRYSIGLLNVNRNPMLRSVYFQTVTLVLNLKG